jgi:hypothetical protein
MCTLPRDLEIVNRLGGASIRPARLVTNELRYLQPRLFPVEGWLKGCVTN